MAILQKKKKVAVLFCGGTMSSFRDPKSGGEHHIEKKEDLLEIMPHLKTFPVEFDVYTNILKKRFFLTTSDFKPIIEFIQQKAQKYDGFIVVQETDTIIYGSSLLGFLTSQFSKPVIFTASPTAFGSIYENTAEENFLGALLSAASDIGETAIFSNGKLVRSVRAKRQNIMAERTFYSSVIDDIGEMRESSLHLSLHRIRRDDRKIKFPYQFPEKKIFFFRYFPDFPKGCLDILYEQHFDGVVIESLGYGSLPPSILERLNQFHDMGTKMVVVAEFDSPMRTFPLDADEAYRPYPHVSLIKNMTVGATLVKTGFVLQNFPKEFHEKMNTNFCGDIVQ